MNRLVRSAVVVAVAFLLAGCLFGFRFACDSAGLRLLIQEDRRSGQLQQFQRSTYRHNELREQVVRELIAQRCSLSEALARWQELDREWLQELGRELPGTAIGISKAYRSAWSDADCYYRLISRQAADLLHDRPKEKTAVLHRLEKDYQQLQRHNAATIAR